MQQVDNILVDPYDEPEFANGQLKIRRNGYMVRVQTAFGLVFDYYGWFQLYVYFPKRLTGITNGLTGIMDNKKTNDMTDSNGVNQFGQPNGASHFGNSWQVPDPQNPG